MCEYCGLSGPCVVCGRTGDSAGDSAADLAALIRDAERRLADARLDVQLWEGRLERLRKLDGRRPGDGSDQPALFDAARQPSIF